MSEKGGKGFSAPTKGVKSSLKSTSKDPVSKGKDASSGKKRGRKVQFDPEGQVDPKSSFPAQVLGKADSIFGNLAKGAKGDKAGKTSAPKEAPPLELRVEQELPTHAKCIMDCEAAQILQGIQEQMVVLSEDPTIKIPIPFDRGLQFAKIGNCYSDPQKARQVLEALSTHGVADSEICVIANTCPETTDEVFALVPSLKPKKSQLAEPLKEVLSNLAKVKESI